MRTPEFSPKGPLKPLAIVMQTVSHDQNHVVPDTPPIHFSRTVEAGGKTFVNQHFQRSALPWTLGPGQRPARLAPWHSQGELRRLLRTWRRPRLRWRPGLRRTPIGAYIESPSTVPKIVGTGQEPPPCPTGVGCNRTAQRSSTGTSAARHLLPSKLEPLRARENRSSCRPWLALAQHWDQAFQARAGTPQDAQQLH